ncbi:MAG TPA: cyanophycin synthetase [Dehalococcoidia bacterium]|nr:cyanophycin synthetase [Dehalococcoidia bacterium]
MKFSAYREAVRYLVDDLWHAAQAADRPREVLQRRVKALLEELGNPQTAFPVVHVGGTTGKGSTAAMTAAVLEEAGLRVGLYVSPFLQTYVERISVNGELISPDQFASAVDEIKPSIRGLERDSSGPGRPTILEALFAMGMRHFEREAVDVAVVEVGLGGRTDCTNVFEPSAVSVITNVQLDHTRQLGTTPEAIAREKAAIIKAGTRALTGAAGGALGVIEERCRQLGVELWRAGKEVQHVDLGCEAEVKTPQTTLTVTPAMAGRHQHDNAALAVAAADAFGLASGMTIGATAMKAGIARARQPGRLEIVQRRPTVILDAAHNPAAADVLATALKDSELKPAGRLVVLIGVLEDKDREGILSRLAPLADEMVVTQPPLAERAGDAADVATIARRHVRDGVRVELVEAPEAALQRALEVASAEDTVCVTGSIYLIGLLRNQWFPEEQILTERRIRYAV